MSITVIYHGTSLTVLYFVIPIHIIAYIYQNCQNSTNSFNSYFISSIFYILQED